MSALLEVKNLKVHFPVKHGMFSRVREFVKAVDDVSFSIAPGETLGLVGESGCGKTTLGRTLLGLQRETSGEIRLDGAVVSDLPPKAARRRRLVLLMTGDDRLHRALERRSATEHFVQHDPQ